MKILYLCHRFPYPPKRGGKIRPFNMIRHFAEQGHQVTVASHVRSREEAREGEGIAPYCQRFLQGPVGRAPALARMVLRLPTTIPSSMGYFHSPPLARELRRLLATESFDLIFVHCSSAAHYVAHLEGVAKILDFGDMDSQKWLIYSRFRGFPLSLGYWLEGTKLRREEARLARCFDLSTCTTRAELDTLDGYATGARTGWFPNGVDATFFSPAARPPDPATLCFVGRMDYYPNQVAMLKFCADVWPRLRERHPTLELRIVGADPSPAIRQLGGLAGVTVTGSVPDVRPWVSTATFTVAPLTIARGTQNKILESLAMGVPVVCSRLAAGGVDAVPGEHLLVADTAEEYLAAADTLLGDPARRRALADAGRARVLSHHDWQASMQRLDALVEQVVAAPVSAGTTAGAATATAAAGTSGAPAGATATADPAGETAGDTASLRER